MKKYSVKFNPDKHNLRLDKKPVRKNQVKHVEAIIGMSYTKEELKLLNLMDSNEDFKNAIYFKSFAEARTLLNELDPNFTIDCTPSEFLKVYELFNKCI